MNYDPYFDFLNAKSDKYKQLLLKQDRRNIAAYEKRLDTAYEELKDIVETDIYEKIVNISDQLLRAVIGYTFECFADLLADLEIENEENREND